MAEAITNVAVGLCVATLAQIAVFPLFGLYATIAQNLKLGAIFTVASIVRSFSLRRLFEHVRVRMHTPDG